MLVTTQNALFFPIVILLGAFIVPVTFVAYFYDYVRDRDISLPLLTSCFVVGGTIGVIVSGFIEYGTLRNLGVASLFGVGFIEESAKLIFPIVMFVMWKYRHEADGLLFGVAAGMGFAALETMGYAMVELVKSGGSVGTLQQVLLIRGLLSPSGHAAWTGFVCAVLWRQRQKTGRVVRSTGPGRIHISDSASRGLGYRELNERTDSRTICAFHRADAGAYRR